MPSELKGTAFPAFFTALRTLRGKDAEQRVIAELPDALRQLLQRNAIARVGWYPLRDYAAVHATTARVLGTDETFARQIGIESTKHDITGVLRFVLSMTSPDLLVRHSNLVFSSYFRGPTFSIDELGPHRYRITFEGTEGLTRLVAFDIAAGTQFLLENTGAQGVEVKVVGATDPTLAFVAAWQA